METEHPNLSDSRFLAQWLRKNDYPDVTGEFKIAKKDMLSEPKSAKVYVEPPPSPAKPAPEIQPFTTMEEVNAFIEQRKKELGGDAYWRSQQYKKDNPLMKPAWEASQTDLGRKAPPTLGAFADIFRL